MNQQPSQAARGSEHTLLQIEIHEDPSSLLQRWNELAQLPGNSLHQSSAWCLAWYRSLGEKPLIVHGRDSNRTCFILPLIVSHLGPVRIARFPAGHFNNFNSGMMAEGFQPSSEETAALLESLKKAMGSHADVLILDAVSLEWQHKRHPFHAFPSIVHTNTSFQLPLFRSFEQTLAQVNAKRRRKKFRVQVRRIEEAGGYEVHTPSSITEQHALLDLFFKQKHERFQAAGLPDVFQSSAVRNFFHALIDSPQTETEYALRLSALKLKAGGDGEVAAICGLSRAQGHVICQFGSIDERRVPDASPGELLFWHMIEDACASGAEIFDFGMGDQAYKRSWCPVETTHHDLIVPLTAKGRLASLAHRGFIRLKTGIKQNKGLYRLVQKLRAKSTTPDQAA
ncbi:GNAT family N-acetyltransferase [Rhizobium helianthi]|uniref:GNAT family N-acetyltransferase n=1 Tax=Rhizobium helianthi TaxID=1132695 RepID=A0ABW4LXZ9_9HYPH